ncbi:MAG: ATP-binding protein [Myxococcota bacterium]|nr:ATP-binding protein [Myxococcota bacterium]
MHYFEPNEQYVIIYEALALIQGCLLAYLLAQGSKDPIKRNVDYVVGASFLYFLFGVPVGRVMFRLAPAGYYEHFGLLPDYVGIPYQTWLSISVTFLFCFYFLSIQLWYRLLNRSRDVIFYICATGICIGVIMSLFFTEHILSTRKQGIYAQMIMFPVLVYGLVILWRGFRRMEPSLERKRVRIFFYAYLFPIMGIFINVVLMSLNLIDQPQSNINLLIIGGMRSALFVWAIVIYGVFIMELSYASEDIFEKMDDPVLLLSPKGEVTRLNPSAQHIFNLEPAEDETAVLPNIRDLLPNYAESETRFEASIDTADQTKEYNCAQTVIVRNNYLVGSVLLFRDVTKEKELARMKTEFTSTVSHELRTPLTSVLGFAKIIQKRFHEVVLVNFAPAEKKEKRAVSQIGTNLEIIISESHRLTKLINDVLDISKMEAGRIEWRFARANPNEAIEQALQATDGLFGSKPVQLVRDIQPKVPDVVIDPDRIIQVIINLISNAVKFTEEGSVTVRTEVQKRDFLLHVQDTGAGISKADQKLVFEKYKQVGDVITDKPQGTGLGLPISKHIVEEHGGRIWVDSTPDKGTTFSFSLPLADPTQDWAQVIGFTELLSRLDRLRYTPTEGTQTVFIIDDDDAIRQLLRKAFEEAGHNVLEAPNGEIGLSMVHEHHPNLIVLDVMMPKMNGFDVVHHLKNDPSYMGIPILMLTVVDDAQKIYGSGVASYITKPFDPKRVLTEGETLIQQRRQANTAVLLGQLGDRLPTLRNKLQENGYTLHVAHTIDDLSPLLHKQTPHVLIVSAEEYPSFSERAMQSSLESTAFFTHCFALKADRT